MLQLIRKRVNSSWYIKKLYDQRDLYVRPLDMFLSDVDHEKYPDVKQKERFKLMSGRD